MPTYRPPKHVFVLMLENRSFDHMLGYSEIQGLEPGAGQRTAVEGLRRKRTNRYRDKAYPVERGAAFHMRVDPKHEFHNVLDQLCGPRAVYRRGGAYPAIRNSGFVDSFVASGGGRSPGEVLKCFDTAKRLPVLNALARSFVVCDHWYSALPGPTCPNRLFVHAASSAGLDHSPSKAEVVWWESLDGIEIPNGTIFDRLRQAGHAYHLYSGDRFPLVGVLKGVHLWDIDRIPRLVADLAKPRFPYDYVFIEPSYNALGQFRGSSCQHPLADVRQGELLVKQVYEAIRNSPHWDDSLLVITWDEHGGFYDHVAPPAAVAPGDGGSRSRYSKHGFTFEQYGVRVPAIIVSPNVGANVVDHRTYSHASVPATLCRLLQLPHLTERDRHARDLLALLKWSAKQGEGNHPNRLPSPRLKSPNRPRAGPVAQPNDPVDDGVMPQFIQAALHQHIAHDPASKDRHLHQVASLETRADAQDYLKEAEARLAPRGA